MELDIKKLLTKRKQKPNRIPTPEIEPDSFVFLAALAPDELDLLQSQWSGYQEAQGLEGCNVGFRKFVFAWGLADSDNKRLLDPGTDPFSVSKAFVDGMEALAANTPIKSISRFFSDACIKYHLTAEDIESLVKNSSATDTDDGSGNNAKLPESVESNGSDDSKTPTKSRNSKRSKK